MNAEIFAALAQLEKERGIPQQYMIDKITQALVAAYKKDKEGYTDNVFVEVEDGDLKMYVQKEVVDDVLTPATEISLSKLQTQLDELSGLVDKAADDAEGGAGSISSSLGGMSNYVKNAARRRAFLRVQRLWSRCRLCRGSMQRQYLSDRRR